MQVRDWTDDELDALDNALASAKHAEGWLEEVKHETLGDDGPAVDKAVMLAWELRRALEAIDHELRERRNATEAAIDRTPHMIEVRKPNGGAVFFSLGNDTGR